MESAPVHIVIHRIVPILSVPPLSPRLYLISCFVSPSPNLILTVSYQGKTASEGHAATGYAFGELALGVSGRMHALRSCGSGGRRNFDVWLTSKEARSLPWHCGPSVSLLARPLTEASPRSCLSRLRHLDYGYSSKTNVCILCIYN